MYFNSRKSVEPQDDRRRKPKNLKRLKTASVLRDESEWLPIPIEPIISRDVWDAVQVKIRENFQKSPGRRLNDYIFLGGRLRCYCGYAMSGYTCRGRRYYRCVSKGYQRPCKGRGASDELETRVWDVISSNLEHEASELMRKLESYRHDEARQKDQTARQIESLETRLADLSKQQNRLLDVYLAGTIDQVTYADRKASIDKEMADLQQAVDSLRSAAPASLDQALETLRHAGDLSQRVTIAQRREVLEHLKVYVVYKDMDHVRVFFNLPGFEYPQPIN